MSAERGVEMSVEKPPAANDQVVINVAAEASPVVEAARPAPNVAAEAAPGNASDHSGSESEASAEDSSESASRPSDPGSDADGQSASDPDPEAGAPDGAAPAPAPAAPAPNQDAEESKSWMGACCIFALVLIALAIIGGAYGYWHCTRHEGEGLPPGAKLSTDLVLYRNPVQLQPATTSPSLLALKNSIDSTGNSRALVTTGHNYSRNNEMTGDTYARNAEPLPGDYRIGDTVYSLVDLEGSPPLRKRARGTVRWLSPDKTRLAVDFNNGTNLDGTNLLWPVYWNWISREEGGAGPKLITTGGITGEVSTGSGVLVVA